MRFYICALIIFASVFPVEPLHSQTSDPLAGTRWESLGSRKGVKRARTYIRSLGLYAVRGELVIKRPIGIVGSIICDHTRWKEWTRTLAQTKILGNTSDGQPIVYQSFDMPVLISDRDVVYSFGLTQEGPSLIIIGQSSPRLLNPKSVGVRMTLDLGRWTLTPLSDNETHLVVEVLMNPKGRLPKWFVNLVQRNYAADTLANLRDQSTKTDIRPLASPINGCALQN